MRQIIVDVLEFVNTNAVGPSLRPATSMMDHRDLRVICINLLAWWGRGTLMNSSHPYMPLSSRYPWCQRLAGMVQATPELQELVDLDEHSCRFAPTIARDEWQQINNYVQEHFRPPLRTKTPRV
jgi:hypothetical protein